MHRFTLAITGLLFLQACSEPVKAPKAETPSTSRALPAAPQFVFATGQAALDSMANRFETLIFNARKDNDQQALDSILPAYIDSLYNWPDTSRTYYNRLQSIADEIINSKPTDGKKNKLLTLALAEKAFDLDENHRYYQASQYIHRYLEQDSASESISKSLKGRLGDIYVRWGDNRKGMEYLLESYRYFKMQTDSTSRQKAANNCVSIANNFNQQGKYSNALAFTDSGLAVIADSKNGSELHKARIRLLGVKAETFLHMKDLAAAEKFAKQAIELIPRDKSRNFVRPDLLSEDLAILGEIRVEERNFLEAKDYFSRAVQSMIAANDGSDSVREVGKLYNSLGQVFDSLGQTDSALLYYHLGLATVSKVDRLDHFDLPQPDSLDAENTIMESLDLKASVFEKKFKQNKDPRYLQSAVRCYELAFKVAALLMQQYQYDEAKLNMSADSRLRTEKALGACFNLYRLKIPGNWVEKAIQFEENSKAILLQETVHYNLFLSLNRGQSAASDSILLLQRQLWQIEKELKPKNLSANDSAHLKDEKNRLTRILNPYKQKAEYQHYFTKAFEPGNNLSFDRIRKELLPGNTALVEYFSGDSTAYAMALNSKGQAEMIELPPQALPAVDSLRKRFGQPGSMNKNPILYQDEAYRVYHLLLQPLTIATAARSLIIIPDGTISYLPFDGLVTRSSDTSNWQKLPYLVHQYDITQGYSTATLLQQATGQNSYPQKALGLAPVHFAGADSLHYSQPELKALEQYLKGNFYTEEKAGSKQLKQDLANDSFEVLHIATHAFGDTGSSRQPFLLFSKDSLKLDEIYALSVKVRLVVLSACQTAIGQLQTTEGPMSLNRGFIYAGAQEMITSLWNVNDRSTAELFSYFYKNAGKDNYTLALQKAKLDYLNTADMNNEKYAPYYWAGFIKMGVSRPREQGSNYWLWWVAGILALAGAWLVFRKKK